MYFKNASMQDLETALNEINKKYDGNVTFKRLDWRGKQIIATLRVKNSHGKGAKIGYTDRHTIAACWHAHGDFFDALLKINPNIIIESMNRKIFVNTNDNIVGNWVDWNVGSKVFPKLYSASCECHYKFDIKTMQQHKLTSECCDVQIWGLKECNTCEAKNTDDCGGQKIRKTGKNEKGWKVPL